ncbi:hypothetical protein C8C83_5079 [Flavobacterium sp. 90]|nr:hypothetical protein C8C82_5425 [Flavobacterium sp. 81]TCK57040.1 hypothetical protein C8C83_5079 [Flavobacterium sp. 90]
MTLIREIRKTSLYFTVSLSDFEKSSKQNAAQRIKIKKNTIEKQYINEYT